MGNFAHLQIQPDSFDEVEVAFGDWMPDLMNLNNPGACEALNVIPKENGYGPFFTLSIEAGLNIPNPCKGALSVNDRFGANHLYAADKDHLYYNMIGPPSFVLAFTAGVAHQAYYLWQFVPFGQTLVALHPEEFPQAVALGVAAPFAALAGSPPKAACGARVGDFLVLGNLTNDFAAPATANNRIRWSGFNNITSPWITDPLTQADFNEMPIEGGAVIAICGREDGTVFQERLISRMSYVGGSTVFDIKTVEEDRGAISVGCVIDIGAEIFFIAEDGFFLWNGTNSVPIGNDRVNRYFYGRINYSERRRIVGSVDYLNECVHWAFPVGSGTTLSEIITFAYRRNRWSHTIYDVEYLLPQIMDVLAGDPFQKPMAGFSSSHAFGFFNAAYMPATLDTAESTGPKGRRVLIKQVTPVVDNTGNLVTVQAAVRDQAIGGALTYGAATPQETDGKCSVLAEGRYARFRVNIPNTETWGHAHGVNVNRKPLGQS